MSNSNSYHHPTNSSSARSVLRRSRYTTGGSTSVTSASERSRILLDHNGFPVETVPAPQEHSSSTHNADSNANPSSSSSYVSNSAVSTADEILKRVQESRRRRAAAASSSSSQSVSGSVYSTASSSVNRNYHSNNHMNEVPPVTPNTLRTLEASRQKNKALAMEYGMALEASKARMVALERELEELNEFKNMEHDAFSASSQQYNDIQEKLKEAEQKYKDLHSELVRMQNSHQVQQHSLSSTLELAKSQSEDDHQRIIYLEKQVNSLQEDLRTASMENDLTKFVKLSVTEHQEILSVLKANTERITTLESQNRSLQSQNTHLQKQNEESLAEFQSTLKDLEKFHSNVHHEYDSSLKNGQEEIDMLNNKIDKQLEEINRKDKTIKDLERKMMQQENIVDEADRLRKELSAARDDLADVKSRSKTRINFYENKLQTSQSTSDDAERKAREMNLRNKVLEVELREQKTNLLKRDEIISSLKAHLEEINEKHEDEMVKIRKDAEASENSKALLESYATKLELLTQNNKLLSAKEISLARCVKQRETEIADLEQKLAEAEDEIKRLTQSKVDETVSLNKSNMLESKVDELEKALENERRRSEILSKQVEEVEHEIGEVRRDRDNLKIQRRHIEGLLDEAKSENDHIRNHQLTQLMNENDGLNKQISDLRMEKKSLEATVELYDLNLEESDLSANEALTTKEVQEKGRIVDGALMKYLAMARSNVVDNMMQKTESPTP